MSGSANLDALLAEAHEAAGAAQTLQDLAGVRARFLGRKGSVSQLLRGIGSLPPEERGPIGQQANEAKRTIEGWVAERRAELERRATEQTLAEHRLDVTLPGAVPPAGHLHPITHVTRDMVTFFTSLGFSIEEGPEVETDFNNFEALNIPPDHPARDEQDTFYIDGDGDALGDGDAEGESRLVLRTHTSNVQIRAMTGRTPPFRFIALGRVYRHDLSPRHSPMFHQIEGFLVDDRVTFGDLKGVLYAFGRHLFGDAVQLRFRANHFPFTEPSAELDYACTLCRGEGCKVCSGSGWIEWGGCGMIEPRVLLRCGIDPDRYQGFAFGMGTDRTAMRRFGLPHLRHLFDGDVRVLEQV